MPDNPKSVTYTINISNKLKTSSDDELKMMVQVARICVLYEDFMLEVDHVLKGLQSGTSGYAAIHRNFYFARRAMATTWEMKQAVDTLCLNPEFKKRKAEMEPRLAEPWDEAVKFFHKHQTVLKAFRNDYGGHFTDAAARFAIEHMPPQLEGDLVVTQTPGGAALAMPFAGQILAVGLVKDRPHDQDYQQFLSSTFTLTVGAQKHALNIAHIIADEFFLRT